jgi:hypothetical protein
MIPLISKILNSSLKSVGKSIATSSKTGLVSKYVTPTRLRGIGVAAAGYYGGNYAIDKFGQELRADYGQETATRRYGAGEGIAREITNTGALSSLVIGGIAGASLTKGLLGASSSVMGRFTRAEAYYRLDRLRKYQSQMEAGRSYAYGPMAKAPKKGGSWLKSPVLWAIAGPGAAGIGAGAYFSSRTPVALESSNMSMYGSSSANDRLNFSTAGLTLALHDRRSRRV